MAIDDGCVASNSINPALKNMPITVYGDGAQTRSLCFASDLIEGIYKAALLKKPINTPINLGNSIEYTMYELAIKIIELTKSNSKIIYLPLRADGPRQRRPGISLANKILIWYPQISIEDGILKTIKYCNKNKK